MEQRNCMPFFELLAVSARESDASWVSAARSVLSRAALQRHGSRFRRRKMADPLQHDARKLEAWAELNHEGLRKIVKKYNKKCAESLGRVALHQCGSLAFVRSTTALRSS